VSKGRDGRSSAPEDNVGFGARRRVPPLPIPFVFAPATTIW
jgi:hypothetical protein